ncbi:hypothetical protein [Algibacter luteus]|uniref:hypothetical protein n=1 Tax=Algibacter luteus TaxID=1178825 RepID=UPI002593B019|nr:hypothetical protein [Algibacter luteus]WJJ97351.1 hypothetical protein O5O44_02995 [Algibacter luteus]
MHKSILLMLLGLFLFSCGNTKVLKAEKVKVIPGVPHGTPVLRFSIEVELKKSTQFLSFKIDDSPKYYAFSVTNLVTNLQSNNNMFYPKGKYKLQIDLPFEEKFNRTKSLLEIELKSNEHLTVLTKTTDTLKVVNLR